MGNETIQVLMEGLDETNIVSVLNKWKEINEVKKQLIEWEDALKANIKNHLKERKWAEYFCDDNKINVTLRVDKKETIDIGELKKMLKPIELSKVTRISTYERLTITTAEMREKMKKYLKKSKVV